VIGKRAARGLWKRRAFRIVQGGVEVLMGRGCSWDLECRVGLGQKRDVESWGRGDVAYAVYMVFGVYAVYVRCVVYMRYVVYLGSIQRRVPKLSGKILLLRIDGYAVLEFSPYARAVELPGTGPCCLVHHMVAMSRLWRHLGPTPFGEFV
jgi:hypothetical protein